MPSQPVTARTGYDAAALEREEGYRPFLSFLKAFWRNHMAVVGAFLLIVITLAAILAPVLAPYPPGKINLETQPMKEPPGARYLLGTDDLGRDVLSRLMFGAQISLSVGVISALLAVTIGMLIGALAGFHGGTIDIILMRIVDALLCFPTLFLVIILSAYIKKPAIWQIIFVIGITGWMGTSRLVRGQILSLKEQEFVEAARALGISNWRIIWRHILPNVFSPVIVSCTLAVAYSILYESALSFLGFGIQPPTASWGNMLTNAQDIFYDAWWCAVFPGALIFLTVFCVNLVGDGLRDALDPRLKNTK